MQMDGQKASGHSLTWQQQAREQLLHMGYSSRAVGRALGVAPGDLDAAREWLQSNDMQKKGREKLEQARRMEKDEARRRHLSGKEQRREQAKEFARCEAEEQRKEAIHHMQAFAMMAGLNGVEKSSFLQMLSLVHLSQGFFRGRRSNTMKVSMHSPRRSLSLFVAEEVGADGGAKLEETEHHANQLDQVNETDDPFNYHTEDSKDSRSTAPDSGVRSDIHGDTAMHDESLHVHLNRWTSFAPCVGLIYVVDSTDRLRLSSARRELESLLNEDALGDAVNVLLVFANFQDLPGALTDREVAECLGLQSLVEGQWHVQGCCALFEEGLAEGFDWFFQTTISRSKRLLDEAVEAAHRQQLTEDLSIQSLGMQCDDTREQLKALQDEIRFSIAAGLEDVTDLVAARTGMQKQLSEMISRLRMLSSRCSWARVAVDQPQHQHAQLAHWNQGKPEGKILGECWQKLKQIQTAFEEQMKFEDEEAILDFSRASLFKGAIGSSREPTQMHAPVIRYDVEGMETEMDELQRVLVLTPDNMCKDLCVAKDRQRLSYRSLRDKAQAFQDKTEDGADEQVVRAAKEEVSLAKQTLQLVGETVAELIGLLAHLENDFPEVMLHIRVGLPPELVPLWHPSRSLKCFDAVQLLPSPSRNCVYRGTFQGQLCAIKEFPITGGRDGVRIWFREARLLHRLQHPCIVQFTALFEDVVGPSHHLFIQMPFYHLGPVDEWIEREQPNSGAVCRVMHGAMEALGHLHAHQVVRADVKPKNLLIDAKGRPRLADFDISVDASTRLTAQYTRVGSTLGFAAPELLQTGPSYATDMFAYGSMLQLLVGLVAAYDQATQDPALELAVLLQDEALLRRPTAAQAIGHSYFDFIWTWRREETRACAVCQDLKRLANGLECSGAAAGDAHFLCDSCLDGYVRAQSERELRLLSVDDGQIRCPEPGCTSVFYSDAHLARHIPTQAFAAYLKCRQQLLEVRLATTIEEDLRPRLTAELQRQQALQAGEQARQHIVEQILTLRCPRCSTAFLDFEACFALTCRNCPCGFCAWCLADCGGNAHEHVRNCGAKPPGSDVFFGSAEDFQRAQNKRRQKLLSAYLDTLPDHVKTDTIHAIRGDLAELGMVFP